MLDLTTHASTWFYAGHPDRVSATELFWDDGEYSMAVRAEGDDLVAVMTSGNCEWRTPIDPLNFKSSVDVALEDAYHLGSAANWTNDD